MDDLPIRLAKFAAWAMREGSWQGYDLDGGAVQEKAVELGLIVKTAYDPAEHGSDGLEHCEPGDDWFTFAPEVSHLIAE